MKTYFLKFTFFLFALAITFSSCEKDDSKSKKSNFNGPEEYIENPSVKSAIEDSRIPMYLGENPPALAGRYLTNGEVEDTSYGLSELIGMQIRSEFELFNQTSSGIISFREKIEGASVSGIGGYITGENGRFTIYGESKQSGSEAGLPDDISMNVVLLMSGTKISNGDLIVKGISIITDVKTSNKQYNVKDLEGGWWMWEADFDLQTGTRSSIIIHENINADQTMKSIMREAIKKFTKLD